MAGLRDSLENLPNSALKRGINKIDVHNILITILLFIFFQIQFLSIQQKDNTDDKDNTFFIPTAIQEMNKLIRRNKNMEYKLFASESGRTSFEKKHKGKRAIMGHINR